MNTHVMHKHTVSCTQSPTRGDTARTPTRATASDSDTVRDTHASRELLEVRDMRPWHVSYARVLSCYGPQWPLWAWAIPTRCRAHCPGEIPLNSAHTSPSERIDALRTELYASAAAATASTLTVAVLEQDLPIQQQLPQRDRRNSMELVLMLNGLCYGAQNERQGQPFFPTRAQERMVAAGNRWLRVWANAQVPRVPVLDRSVSMLVPPLDESPCFHHHPYGIMSELHVQIGLQALLC